VDGNVYPDALIYPGIGLGTIISRAKKVTDGMIIAGARRLGALSPALEDPDAALLPDFEDSPKVNVEVSTCFTGIVDSVNSV
jgi:malate dehydrogenase (oxaloacetate-decarboxylating)